MRRNRGKVYRLKSSRSAPRWCGHHAPPPKILPDSATSAHSIFSLMLQLLLLLISLPFLPLSLFLMLILLLLGELFLNALFLLLFLLLWMLLHFFLVSVILDALCSSSSSSSSPSLWSSKYVNAASNNCCRCLETRASIALTRLLVYFISLYSRRTTLHFIANARALTAPCTSYREGGLALGRRSNHKGIRTSCTPS